MTMSQHKHLLTHVKTRPSPPTVVLQRRSGHAFLHHRLSRIPIIHPPLTHPSVRYYDVALHHTSLKSRSTSVETCTRTFGSST